ncbi:hypothetical protein L596_024867 [Steinernema carpocapsae]|uniref:RING finger protein 113A n=1 Tax=Steinernema carpocapsae TaxID=34508 RepID=A0A4U5M624_STECR|nr:hypothetical protein L596_024867 [Steinernema carpocapsae]
MSEEKPVTFFRRASKRPAVRQAKKESSDESDGLEFQVARVSDVKFKKRHKKGLSSSTNKIEPEESDGSSFEEAEDDEREDEPTSSKEPSKPTPGGRRNNLDAPGVWEIDTDITCDAQAQFERVQEELKKGIDTKVYKGAALYGASIKEDSVKGKASSGLVRQGQIRANRYMRANVRWDFAPDVCKDYKETGFCTFGDSCKFMHDRSDYKHGWEIERDFQEGKMDEEDDDKYVISESDEDDEKNPTSCFICTEPFTAPVQASCGHFFCEKCALEHSKKKKKCPICAKVWTGSFKYAKELAKKLKEREEKRQREEEAEDEGEGEGCRSGPS